MSAGPSSPPCGPHTCDSPCPPGAPCRLRLSQSRVSPTPGHTSSCDRPVTPGHAPAAPSPPRTHVPLCSPTTLGHPCSRHRPRPLCRPRRPQTPCPALPSGLGPGRAGGAHTTAPCPPQAGRGPRGRQGDHAAPLLRRHRVAGRVREEGGARRSRPTAPRLRLHVPQRHRLLPCPPSPGSCEHVDSRVILPQVRADLSPPCSCRKGSHLLTGT